MNYLGKHTAIAYLKQKQWDNIPYLKDNNGHLPPLIIAVGDARRIEIACQTLNLTNIIKLHEESEKLLGLKGRGRVDLVLGTYTHQEKSIPLLLVETQMGMPATEINLREVISHCSQEYHFNNTNINTNAIHLIRVGTAGGINDPKSNETTLQVGDLVNGTFGIGWSGTLIESLGGLDFANQNTINTFKDNWIKAGHEFTNDQKYPLGRSSKEIISVINQAAKKLNINCYEGGNFSKDSLYAEMDDEAFINLRKKYNVMSTEMEQMAVCKLVGDFKQAGINLNTGLISGIIGTIPGASFADKYEEVEQNALRVAALALWKLVDCE